MSDYTLEPCSRLISGMTGSGKTTFALAHLKKTDAACRFIFDDRGRMSERLGVRKNYTATELETALASKWVAFYPHKMFPPELTDEKERADKKAFKFFCEWSYGCAKRADGKKIFLTDEVWQYCSRNHIPWELDAISRMGREENLELVVCTQTPRLIPENMIGQFTDFYFFKLDADLEKQFIKKNFPVRFEEISALPLGSYIHWEKLTNKILRGKVF